VPDLAFVHLGQRDVVRHRIVADIVAAYEGRRPSEDRDEP
jgi:phosphate starvation-inducible protein PhoH